IHKQTLKTLQPHFTDFKSHRSCFCCFMCMPEKVMACGHTLYNTCIRIYSQRSILEQNTYAFSNCLLCGVQGNMIFRLVPPSAGIRVLSLDGGGIQAVVPLVFLSAIKSRLSSFKSLVTNYFNFVGGTLAG
ncbi:hypothetical protein BCR34DRAFT_501395, partial [Clohesyomyces aquaticus]